jgi:hypothetical protein
VRPIVNRQSAIGNAPDPRHQPLMDEIDALYKRYNEDVPAPDMGRTANALHRFLKENPGWTVERMVRAMRNRYYSIGVNWSEAPWQWIVYLPMYARDPLDKYRQPMRGKGDEVAREWEEMLRAER